MVEIKESKRNGKPIVFVQDAKGRIVTWGYKKYPLNYYKEKFKLDKTFSEGVRKEYMKNVVETTERRKSRPKKSRNYQVHLTASYKGVRYDARSVNDDDDYEYKREQAEDNLIGQIKVDKFGKTSYDDKFTEKEQREFDKNFKIVQEDVVYYNKRKVEAY